MTLSETGLLAPPPKLTGPIEMIREYSSDGACSGL